MLRKRRIYAAFFWHFLLSYPPGAAETRCAYPVVNVIIRVAK
ncbi:hypothetical protein F9C28_06150 [Shimwellia pseudoproteus]|nr:hypothetical protein [Shimwellia pseudoproteus]